MLCVCLCTADRKAEISYRNQILYSKLAKIHFGDAEPHADVPGPSAARRHDRLATSLNVDKRNRDLATMIRESVKHIDFGKVKLKEISLVEVAVDDDARVPVKQRRRGAHPPRECACGLAHISYHSAMIHSYRRVGWAFWCWPGGVALDRQGA